MLLSRDKRWLFISTMKCATNGIYEGLKSNGIRIGSFHNRTSSRQADIHWTVRRNPYDRAVSIWASTCKRGPDRYKAIAQIKKYKGDSSDFRDFCRFCLAKRWTRNALFLSQSEWWKGLLIDKFARFEHLEEDVSEIIGEKVSLPVKNKSEHSEFAAYSTKEVIGIINTWAEKDFRFYERL